jgi:DNA-binding MarR family transcriptional regulator
LGHLLRPLERRGLVTLCVADEDGRCRRIELTGAGGDALSAGRPLWARAQRRFEAAVGKGASQELRELLSRVVAADFGRLRADR